MTDLLIVVGVVCVLFLWLVAWSLCRMAAMTDRPADKIGKDERAARAMLYGRRNGR